MPITPEPPYLAQIYAGLEGLFNETSEASSKADAAKSAADAVNELATSAKVTAESVRDVADAANNSAALAAERVSKFEGSLTDINSRLDKILEALESFEAGLAKLFKTVS